MAATNLLRRLATAAFVAMVATSLAAGLAGGLLRAGVAWVASGPLLAQAGLVHGALMIGGFLGTVIGVERAVALKVPAAFLAPIASGAGGVLLLAGRTRAGAAALALAALLFVGANVLIVRRQAAAHTVLLLAAAAAWLAGNTLFLFGRWDTPVLAWWFAFVVMTIAAERLEMTRMMRRRPGAQALLFVVLALLALGATFSPAAPVAGGVSYGVALAALALWLGTFDVARRTIFTHGLSRYMAVCLLGGYVWLAVAGAAWSATALGAPARDAALHALGLGFIFSMVMGHAPVILPAVTGLKLHFTSAFYLPLALLHASLVVRLASDSSQAAGAMLNAAAIVLFALTVVAAAIRWRLRRTSPLSQREAT